MIEFEWSGVRFSLADCGGGILKETIPMHCHSQNSYELHFVLSGQGTLLTDSGAYKMRAGNFFVTGPGVPHAQVPDLEDPVKDLYIYIQKKNAQKCNSAAKLFLETHFFYHQEFENHCAAEIVKEFKSKYPGREYAAAGLMINLLTRITRLYAPQCGTGADSKHENLNDLRFLIIENMFLYERGFTLKELSQKLGVCERQTQRLLKKYYGKTFREKMRENGQ